MHLLVYVCVRVCMYIYIYIYIYIYMVACLTARNMDNFKVVHLSLIITYQQMH
jgi:hypothetical protein